MNTTPSERVLELCSQAKTLRVSIPPKAEYAPRKPEVYVFNRVSPLSASSDADTEVCVSVRRIIRETDHSTVYLGVFRRALVVLKCCYNTKFYKDFKREAKVYETRLGDLQGDVVPNFYGYYRAVDEEYGPYSLLLLEYCGERINWSFEDLPIDIRVKTLTLLGKFHMKSRLHPMDFAERNVVCRNGDLRLVDFHDVRGHRCEWDESVDWQVGEFDLTAKEGIPCGILTQIGDEMNIWNPFERPMVYFHGRYFLASEFPPQDIINMLVPSDFIGSAKNWVWIEAYLREMKGLMDTQLDKFNVYEQIAKRPPAPLHS